MSEAQPYSTQKLVHHPGALQALRERRHQAPTLVHFMPELTCNQRCHFCAYQSKDDSEKVGWKNKVLMTQDSLPREKMLECLADWQLLGVKAVELTGGGEPLVYPHVDEFLERVARWGVDLALVTNGTALTSGRADLFGDCNWKWARVSIDAGSPEHYMVTRRVSRSHWTQAWAAVERLANRKRTPEQRVGVGFVVDSQNWAGVYNACRLALGHGADNVRVALAFTPQHLSRFPEGAVEEAGRQAAQAQRDFAGRLQVNDFVSERAANIAAEVQDYQFCAVKEVLCVVGGDQNVYTCCSLAFNPLGLIGSIRDQPFRELWDKDARALFPCHDARKVCRVPCLYEKRNKRALELLAMDPATVADLAAGDPGSHRNFV